MEGYYVNCLNNSNIYKNLLNAIKNIEDQIKNLENLEKSFNDVSGNTIELIKQDISNVIAGLTNYYTAIKTACDKLEKNANKFDEVYISWKNKAKGTEEALADFEPPIIWRKYNQDEFEITEKLLKKIKNVEIGYDGYIHVIVWSFISRIVYDKNTGRMVPDKCIRIDKGQNDYIVHFEGKIGSSYGNYKYSDNASEQNDILLPLVGGGSSGGHGF